MFDPRVCKKNVPRSLFGLQRSDVEGTLTCFLKGSQTELVFRGFQNPFVFGGRSYELQRTPALPFMKSLGVREAKVLVRCRPIVGLEDPDFGFPFKIGPAP